MNTDTHTQHTPGPWTVDGCYIHGPSGKRFLAVAGDDEGKANARLIAAAPDLITLVKHVVAMDLPLDILRKRARNALAKAEGRA